MNDGFAYVDATFEMVSIRFINGGIDDWNAFIGEAFRILVGTGTGYIQITEIETKLYCYSNSIPEDSAAKTWPSRFFAAGGDFSDELGTVGFDDIAVSLEKRVQKIGFQVVQHDRREVPVGVWPSGITSPIAGSRANRY